MATSRATTATTATVGSSSSSDVSTNLSNLLPTGTFLTFHALAPLFTNNGHCADVEKIVTGALFSIFAGITLILTFTDSITTTSGKHYYGLVTPWGLYNPQFEKSTIANRHGSFYIGNSNLYNTNIFDYVNGVLAVIVLGVLVLLTPPVSTCYYPHLPATIIKAVPILVGIIASTYFSFAPPPRKGVGFSTQGLVTDPEDDTGPEIPDTITVMTASTAATATTATTATTTTATTAPQGP